MFQLLMSFFLDLPFIILILFSSVMTFIHAKPDMRIGQCGIYWSKSSDIWDEKWNVYVDPQYGYSFKYPFIWTIEKLDDEKVVGHSLCLLPEERDVIFEVIPNKSNK